MLERFSCYMFCHKKHKICKKSNRHSRQERWLLASILACVNKIISLMKVTVKQSTLVKCLRNKIRLLFCSEWCHELNNCPKARTSLNPLFVSAYLCMISTVHLNFNRFSIIYITMLKHLKI